jgi:hypothetical protein
LKDEALQGLHSLEKLEILECPKFNLSTSFGYLTRLEKLDIGNFSDMSGFSEALQHMTSLQFMLLSELPNLTSLPDCLGNLGLLQKLDIYECPNLMCLPSTIQYLSDLQILSIHGSHELENRCREETGEDWPKIAHVQNLLISSVTDAYRITRRAARLFREADSVPEIQNLECLVVICLYYSLIMKKVTLE